MTTPTDSSHAGPGAFSSLVLERGAATLADLVGSLTAPMVGAVRETKALLLGAAARDLDTQRRLERESQARRFRELAALMGAHA